MTTTYTIKVVCEAVSYEETAFTVTINDAYKTLFDKLILGACKGLTRTLNSSAIRQFIDTIQGWLA